MRLFRALSLPWWRTYDFVEDLRALLPAATLDEDADDDDDDDPCPTGFGLTFVNLRALGSPERTVETLLRWGVDWVKVLVDSNSGQASTTFPHLLPDYCAAFREASIEVVGWAYPVPAREAGGMADYAERVAAECHRLHITRVAHNQEKHFRWPTGDLARRKGIEDMAQTLATRTRDAGLRQWCSTYGAVSSKSFRERMPWSTWAAFCEVIQVQWYTSTKQAQHLSYLREKYPGEYRVYPVIGASAKHTASATRKRIAATPHDGGINVWNARLLRPRSRAFKSVLEDMPEAHDQ